MDTRHIRLTKSTSLLCPVTLEGGICGSIHEYVRLCFPHVYGGIRKRGILHGLEAGVPYIDCFNDPGTLNSIIVLPIDMASLNTRSKSISNGLAHMTSLIPGWGVTELAIQNDEHLSLFYDDNVRGVLNTHKGNDHIRWVLDNGCRSLGIPFYYCEDGRGLITHLG